MGLFNFFQNNKLPLITYPEYYSIDLHSHLIPGIDDGAKTLKESIEIISFFKSIGIQKIITTPHISLNYPNNPEKILAAYEQLKTEVLKTAIDIEIVVAAEYMIDDGFREIFESGNLMTFGNSFVLIELSPYVSYSGFSDLLFEMQSKGYNIILAHPERYIFWQNDIKTLKKLKDRDLYFQLNLLSLSKVYSADYYKMALWLIGNGLIDFIGSDIHHSVSIPEIRRALSGKLFQTLISTNQVKNNRLLV